MPLTPARPIAALLAIFLVGGLLACPAAPALAQAESREGIYLQNLILQLRQEMYEALRRGAGAPQLPPPGGRFPQSGGNELVPELLERVTRLEADLNRLRGALERTEFQNRRLAEQVEKLQGDMEYRFNQIERGGGAAPAAPRERPPGRAEAPPGRPEAPPGRVEAPPGRPEGPLVLPDTTAPPAVIPPPPPGTPTPRTPEVALREGQAALSRADHAAAEAAAREALSARGSPRAQDAGILLGDALMGKRDYQNAAIAYDDAYRRNRSSQRAPMALVGLANAFAANGARREACDTLETLRSEFPRLAANVAERVGAARARAGCR